MQVQNEILREITEKIVSFSDPQKIVLFGSHARNEAGKNSDLDLLVIDRGSFGPERSRRKFIAEVRRHLKGYPFPIDIIVSTVKESDQWKDSEDHALERAQHEGKTLYERR